MDNFWIATGSFGAIIGGAYMLWEALRFPRIWRAASGVYILVGLLDLYLATIYTLTLVGFLGIPGYGAFVRPVLFPIVVSPAVIAYISRRIK